MTTAGPFFGEVFFLNKLIHTISVADSYVKSTKGAIMGLVEEAGPTFPPIPRRARYLTDNLLDQLVQAPGRTSLVSC